MKKKLEEIRRNQRIYDKYIDLAVTNPCVFAREYRGYRLFVSGHNLSEGVKDLRQLGAVKTLEAEMIAGWKSKKFYKGDIRECVVIIEAGAFVAVRIGQEVYYVGVENRDRMAVLDIGRRNLAIYDCRGIESSSIADYGDNVVAFSF